MEFSVTNKLRREKEKEYESGGGATSTTTADIEDAYSDIFVKNGGDEVGGGAEPGEKLQGRTPSEERSDELTTHHLSF